MRKIENPTALQEDHEEQCNKSGGKSRKLLKELLKNKPPGG